MNYAARITKTSDNNFYALVVRVDRDGQESVDGTFKGRYFRTEKAAIKSTSLHIAKS